MLDKPSNYANIAESVDQNIAARKTSNKESEDDNVPDKILPFPYLYI